MGCLGSKQKISKVDLEYLKKHTRYDEATIKEWFKGFKASSLNSYSIIFIIIIIIINNIKGNSFESFIIKN